MASKAKIKTPSKKTTHKKKAEATVPEPGKYKANTNGYKIEMVTGIAPNWSRVIHYLKPMDEVSLITYQRDQALLAMMKDPDRIIVESIALHKRFFFTLLEKVEGYEDIPDGEPLTDEHRAIIPYWHVDKVCSRILADVGVIAGERQKNF